MLAFFAGAAGFLAVAPGFDALAAGLAALAAGAFFGGIAKNKLRFKGQGQGWGSVFFDFYK